MSTIMYQNTHDASMHKEAYGHAINTGAEHAGLNAAQLHFLQLLSHIKTDETLADLKRLLRSFYAQQVQMEADMRWEEGKISDGLLNEHLRTPYR